MGNEGDDEGERPHGEGYINTNGAIDPSALTTWLEAFLIDDMKSEEARRVSQNEILK